MISAVVLSCMQQKSNLFGNLYGDAYAIFSLRLVNKLYGGKCIRVRRSSDNTELDIGFLNGVIDTSTLSDFTSSGTAFVTTWYDQSGFSRNITQSTTSRQPRIIISGTLQTAGGFPAIYFTYENINLLFRNDRFDVNGLRSYAVYQKTSSGINTDSENRVLEISGTINSDENDKVGWREGLMIGESYNIATTSLKYKQSSRTTSIKCGSYLGLSKDIKHNGSSPYYAIDYDFTNTKYCLTGYILEAVITNQISIRSYAEFIESMKQFFAL